MAAAGFLSDYLNGPLSYVRRHITVNKMCWVRRYLKHFLPSFLIWVALWARFLKADVRMKCSCWVVIALGRPERRLSATWCVWRYRARNLLITHCDTLNVRATAACLAPICNMPTARELLSLDAYKKCVFLIQKNPAPMMQWLCHRLMVW